MTELTDTLEKLIQQAALDGAMTEDAVAQFHSLVMERNSLKDANDEWEEASKKDKTEIGRLSKRATVAEEECQNWAGKEQDLLDREHICLEKELRCEYNQKRIEDHQEMFKTVFRNSVLRKEVMTPLRGSEGLDQYNSQLPGGFAQKDEVEEEET